MTIEKKIDRLTRKIDRFMIQWAQKIPDKNLPLVNLKGLSESVKHVIETRLKGISHANN
jgi:hypothetical protein